MGFLMLASIPVFAGDPTSTVTGEFGYIFSPITNIQQIGQPIANLVEYQVTFQDTTWGSQYVYVDNNLNNANYQPQYIISNSSYNGMNSAFGYTGKLITNPDQINDLLNQANQLSTPYNYITYSTPQKNLIAYHTQGLQREVLFTNRSNDYVEIGGQVNISQGPPPGAGGPQGGGPQGGGPQGPSFMDINNLDSTFAIYNSFAARLYSLTSNGNFGGFIEGKHNAKKIILVFGEPNCPICNDLYNLTKSYVTSGQLQIEWNLVSFIQPNSRGKVLAILMGDVPDSADHSIYPHTPIGAFSYNEDNFTPGSDNGGAITPISPAMASQAVLTESNNSEFFFENEVVGSAGGTPTIIYQDQTGQYQIQSGLPGSTPQATQNFINSLYVQP